MNHPFLVHSVALKHTGGGGGAGECNNKSPTLLSLSADKEPNAPYGVLGILRSCNSVNKHETEMVLQTRSVSCNIRAAPGNGTMQSFVD